MKLFELPPELQAYARAKLEWLEGRGPNPDEPEPPPPARPAKRTQKRTSKAKAKRGRYDSRTEERYAGELERQRAAGELERWSYVGRRGWTLQVLPDLSYTPDFVVYRRGMPVELVEVKGAKGERPWWRQNGSRERFKAAAGAFGAWYRFTVVWPGSQGGWNRETRGAVEG